MNRSSTSPRSRGPAILLLVILAVAPLLEVSARSGSPDPVASNEGTEGQAVQSAGDAVPTPFPTAGGARDALLAQHAATVKAFNDALAANNATYGDVAPSASVDAFYDPVTPGGRVGGIGDWQVLGGAWHVANASNATGPTSWSIANDTTGKYGAVDSWLVSPAIDLGAYFGQTAQVPFLGAGASTAAYFETVTATCKGAADKSQGGQAGPGVNLKTADPYCPRQSPPAYPLQGLVSLYIHHRVSLVAGVDVGQVYVFTSRPDAHDSLPLDEQAIPLALDKGPLGVLQGTDGNPGFTGSSDWQDAKFDLTPYDGQTIWVAFRVTTSSRASTVPNYFSGLTGPFGWFINDVEITTPAFPNDLKVFSIDGPAFRSDAKDPYDRIVPGSNVTLGATIVNAASASHEARALVEVSAGDVYIRREFNRTLTPGEVWQPNVSFVAPTAEGTMISVNARAWNPSPINGSLVDPSPSDDRLARSFVVSAFPRLELRVAPSGFMVDDGANVTANATVTNTGNVPIVATLSLLENSTLANVTHAAVDVALAPGESRNASWPVGTDVRGDHLVIANATAPGVSLVNATSHYFVHASPPDLFFAGAGHAPGAGWTAEIPVDPIPASDDAMWVSHGVTLPLSLLPQGVAGESYQDLRVKFHARGIGKVALTDGAADPLLARTFWLRDFGHASTDTAQQKALAESVAGNSWYGYDFAVHPDASMGYTNRWTADTVQVRVTASQLDDLVLTGVPLGGDPSQRREIVNVTGTEEGDATKVRSTAPGVTECGGPAGGSSCWSTKTGAQAHQANAGTTWAIGPPDGGRFLLDGEPAVWNASGITGADQLLTPVLHLQQAADATLSFDTLYAFTGSPNDGGRAAEYDIFQLGFVEIQYKQDDGRWSPFQRILPVGGAYPLSGIERTPSGEPRVAAAGFASGDGFFYPAYCNTLCADGGFVKVWDEDHNWIWYRFPYEAMSRPVFRLNEQVPVDISNRDVRLGFHASEGSNIVPNSFWAISNVRVTPVSTFAVDGTIDNVTLPLPYDWARLGVGPGAVVPINVTARNVGQLAEAFNVTVRVDELGGAQVASFEVPLDTLLPGETRSIVLPDWTVPQAEDKLYSIHATLHPARGAGDENAFNDEFVLGARGEIAARTIVDASITSYAFPAVGRETLARYAPLILTNHGNVPLKGVRVERTIESVSGGSRSLVRTDAWTMRKDLVPDGVGVGIQSLDPDPPVSTDDIFFTPGATGNYVITVRVVPLVPDANPADDFRRIDLVAESPFAFEQFERINKWVSSSDGLWNEGDGFRSAHGIVATDPKTGTIPPLTDSWIETPDWPLSRAQTAELNFFTRYDLENGYDGGRVEVSTDHGATWTPLTPSDPQGGPARYPATLVSADPFNGGNATSVGAMSGDSRQDPLNLDGWVPVSIDLGRSPQLTESVPIHELPAPMPAAGVEPVHVAPGVLTAPWMSTDPTDPGASWEIHNEAEGLAARDGLMWWSGGAVAATLQTSFKDLPPLVGQDERIVLTWWEHRAGVPDSPEGVAATYTVSFSQTSTIATSTEPTIIAIDGPWQQRQMEIDASRVDASKPLWIKFVQRSIMPTLNDQGWCVDGIVLGTSSIVGGLRVADGHPIVSGDGAEATWGAADDAPWQRIRQLPSRPAPWTSEVRSGPDGVAVPQWHLNLDGTSGVLDSRLVTPIVDLSQVGGGRTTLDILHSYDLTLHDKDAIMPGQNYTKGKHYQAAVVEVQMFNRTSSQWDPWRQLFADSRGPTPEIVSSTDMRGAAPYPVVMVDAGQSFARTPRSYAALFLNSNNKADNYTKREPIQASFVFAGDSKGAKTDSFDLSPYVGEKVRFAFHEWSTPQSTFNAPDHGWTIASAKVVGHVLSTTDARFRFHLGTDASILRGSWGIDQVELIGKPYARNVAIELDETPLQVAPDGFVNVTGRLVNHAPTTRHLVGVALDVAGVPVTAKVLVGSRVDAPDRTSLLEVGDLAPAGREGSSAPFKFMIHAGNDSGLGTVHLQIVEGSIGAEGLAYLPPPADVPGLASRSWPLRVDAIKQAILGDLVLTPPELAAPGVIEVHGNGTNAGTVPLTGVTVNVSVFSVEKKLVASRVVTIGDVAPGSNFSYGVSGLAIRAIGNDTVVANLTAHESNVAALATRALRVGTTDTAISTSFEDGLGKWTSAPAGAYRVTTDEALFGNHSILLGMNDTEYFDYNFVAEDQGATLTSPTIDLRVAGPTPTLVYWQKTRLGPMGSVQLRAGIDLGPGTTPTCWATLVPTVGSIPARGVSESWDVVKVPLADATAVCSDATTMPLLGNNVTFQFLGTTDGQGWRLDGFTVTGSPVASTLIAAKLDLTDTATKDFPIAITNPGLMRRTVRLAIEPTLSKVTPAQRSWLSISPLELDLAPGESLPATLHVVTPAARGAFPQALHVGVSATDPMEPFAPSVTIFDVSFQPQPRADISLAISLDGQAVLGGATTQLEEGIPHDIAIVAKNTGFTSSAPTTVEIQILDAATGLPVWSTTQPIEGLAPNFGAAATTVIAASWTPPLGARGAYVLHVIADPTHQQVDYDRSNDDVKLPIDVVRLRRPDLAIDAADIGVTAPDGRVLHESTPGSLLSVHGTVRNTGVTTARQVTVRILAGPAILKEETIDALEPGASLSIHANQFAPANTTTYRVLAFTQDPELSLDNNERVVELPIFPPDLAIAAADLAALLPGNETTVDVNVTDTGVYPQVVDLRLDGDERLGELATTRIALAPGESRIVPLKVHARPQETSGDHLIRVQAESAGAIVAQRTVTVNVTAHPAIAAIVYSAAGPPQAVRLDVDLVDQGNVALSPTLRLVAADGSVLASLDAPLVPAGKTRFASFNVSLPATTAPGTLAATLALVADGVELSSAPVRLTIAPWGKLSVEPKALASADATEAYAIHLAYEGNAATVREPVLLGLPPGVTATFDATSVRLAPGGAADLRLRLVSPRDVPTGSYQPKLAFVDADAAPDPAGLLANLTPLGLDLRRANLSFVGKPASSAGASADQLAYVATVRNEGDREARDVPVEMFVDGDLVDHQRIDALLPGVTKTLRLKGPVPSGHHTVVIAIDAAGAHANDSAPFALTIDVAATLGQKAAAPLHALPLPAGGWLAIALVVAGLLRKRGRG